MMNRRQALKILAGLCLAGCSAGSQPPTTGSDTNADKKLANDFAQDLLKGDTSAAEARMTASARGRIKLAEIYAAASKEGGQPTAVEVDSGTVPTSAEQSKEYGIPADVPLASMKAWLCCEMRGSGRGFDMWVLVVDEGGTRKIGHVWITGAD